MRKLLYILLVSILFISCSGSKRDLYRQTDYFVESLATDYQSYGILGGAKYTKMTSDGLYKITPIGRLINVKILEAVDSDVYEDLRSDLESHYKKDSRVNNVYICNAGTVMIDCRN